MSISSNLSLAVLAGGQSRRFGSPKFHARFMSQTLLEIMFQKASRISENLLVIAGQIAVAPQRNIPVYRDIYPDCGPLGGLYTALYYSPRPLVAILPCDMPLLEPQVYRILLENAFSDRPVVAVSHLGLEPLVSVWPVEPSLSVIDKNLKNQKYSFRETIEELKAVKINIQAAMAEYRPEMFININYRDDLRKLEFNLKDKNDFRRP